MIEAIEIKQVDAKQYNASLEQGNVDYLDAEEGPLARTVIKRSQLPADPKDDTPFAASFRKEFDTHPDCEELVFLGRVTEHLLGKYFVYSHARTTKWTDDEMTPELQDLANNYVSCYEGDSEFLNSLRKQFDKGRSLSVAQARGVINNMAAWVRMGFIPNHKPNFCSEEEWQQILDEKAAASDPDKEDL
jgi:hypothetical protein